MPDWPVLTAFYFDGTQLAVHGEVLQVHWTARGDGQPVTNKQTENKALAIS